MRHRLWQSALLVGLFLLPPLLPPAPAPAVGKGPGGEAQILDLSLLVAPDLPCTWAAGNPPFLINHYLKIGPLSPYNSDALTIDEHTGTQLDAPAHFIPPPGSGLPNAGPFNKMTADKVPAWQFVGEACVIDVRDLLDSTPKGRSPLVTKEHVLRWEKKHGKVGPGDVVLFYSGFGDKYYKPFPEGRKFVADPLGALSPVAPAWAPSPTWRSRRTLPASRRAWSGPRAVSAWASSRRAAPSMR